MSDSAIIRILGPVKVRDRPLVGSITPAVLVMLVLGREQQATSETLKTVWPDQPVGDYKVEKMISKIRNFGLVIEKQRHGPYQLKLARDRIDVFQFIDGVEQLPPNPPTEAVDRLLALWHGDPRQHILRLHEKWGFLFRARNKLVQIIEKMSEDSRDRLTELDGFMSLFQDDTQLANLRSGASAYPAMPAKPRVLIVEDEISDVFEYALRDEYECVVVCSLEEWREFAAKRDFRLAAAIVDWNLKDGKDGHGAEVLEYLCDREKIPTLLASQKPHPGPVHDLIEHYQLAGVYNKGPDSTLPKLRQEIARIIREGHPARRQ